MTFLCVTILRVTLALTVLCFVQVSEEVEAVVRQLVTHVSFSTAVADQLTQLQSLEALQTRTWLAEGTAETPSQCGRAGETATFSGGLVVYPPADPLVGTSVSDQNNRG